MNVSKDASFSASFWGGNSCRGCLESKGLNLHPDTLKMVSRIKGLCLKPWGPQSVKTVEKSSYEKNANTDARSYWQVQFKTFSKNLLILVRAKCKTNFTTKKNFRHDKEDQCKSCSVWQKWFLLTVVAYRQNNLYNLKAVCSCNNSFPPYGLRF